MADDNRETQPLPKAPRVVTFLERLGYVTAGAELNAHNEDPWWLGNSESTPRRMMIRLEPGSQGMPNPRRAPNEVMALSAWLRGGGDTDSLDGSASSALKEAIASILVWSDPANLSLSAEKQTVTSKVTFLEMELTLQVAPGQKEFTWQNLKDGMTLLHETAKTANAKIGGEG